MPPSIDPSKMIRAAGEAPGGFMRRGLDWLMSVTTVHPSTHRLKNAVGLTVGMASGRYLMDRVVGETPGGEKIEKEDVFEVLKPLHGKMAYDHFSDDPKDRWMRVVDLWIPAGMGAVGATLGAHDFGLHDQGILSAAKAALANPSKLTLDKAEDMAIATQGKVWRVLSGITSVLGSSSNMQMIPGPTNYGSALGASFLGTVRRNKLHTPYMPFVQKYINSNNHAYPFGPSSMLVKLQDYLTQNPDPFPEQTRSMAKAILEPWFGERGEKQVDAFLEPILKARGAAYKPGGVPASAQADLSKKLSGYLAGEGLEKHLLNIGLNPADAMIGRNGMIEGVTRTLGGEAMLNEVEKAFRKGVIQRHGEKAYPSIDRAINQATRAADRQVQLLGHTAMGAMWLGIAYMAYKALSGQKKAEEPVADKEKSYEPPLASAEKKDVQADAAVAAPVQPMKEFAEPRSKASTLLKVAERVTDMTNAPESLSMHRTACALGLSIGGLIGMRLGDVVAGRTLTGTPLPVEKVPSFLKGLYKQVAYNPQSGHSRDRWGYILHFALPAAVGVAGVITASEIFFRNRKKRLSKEAEYIDDYEDRATMAQANSWTPLTALAAVPVTPSGFPYLPLTNYGTALGTRFMLASGRKGVFPGLGEWWNHSTSRYPEGPVLLRDRMLKYALNNKEEDPEQLHEMARGIVRQWFPEASDRQINSFVKKLQKDRECLFTQGPRIPEEIREECEQVLRKHFTGSGLEKTLVELGLDPLKATLGNNGFATTIARHCGAANELDEIHEEYHAKFADRVREQQKQREAAGPGMNLNA